jgi:WXG100 family type VII secretion target
MGVLGDITSGLGSIAHGASEVGEGVVDLGTTGAKDISSGAETVAGDVGHGAETVAGDIGSGAKTVVGDAASGLGGLGNALRGGLIDVGKGAETVAGDVGKGASTVAGDVGSAVEGAAKDVGGFLGDIMHGINGFIDKLIQPLIDLLEKVTGNPSQLREKAQLWQNAAKQLETVAQTLASGLSELSGQWEGDAAQAFASEMSSTCRAIQQLADNFDQTAQSLDQAAEGCEQTAQAIQSIIRSFVEWSVATQAAGAAAALFTAGASEAAAEGAEAAEVAVAVGRGTEEAGKLAQLLQKIESVIKELMSVDKAAKDASWGEKLGVAAKNLAKSQVRSHLGVAANAKEAAKLGVKTVHKAVDDASSRSSDFKTALGGVDDTGQSFKEGDQKSVFGGGVTGTGGPAVEPIGGIEPGMTTANANANFALDTKPVGASSSSDFSVDTQLT